MEHVERLVSTVVVLWFLDSKEAMVEEMICASTAVMHVAPPVAQDAQGDVWVLVIQVVIQDVQGLAQTSVLAVDRIVAVVALLVVKAVLVLAQ